MKLARYFFSNPEHRMTQTDRKNDHIISALLAQVNIQKNYCQMCMATLPNSLLLISVKFSRKMCNNYITLQEQRQGLPQGGHIVGTPATYVEC